MWPKCSPKVAQMWPEFEILWPEINPWKFPVPRARPGPKLQARNPTRSMKKEARPSPNNQKAKLHTPRLSIDYRLSHPLLTYLLYLHAENKVRSSILATHLINNSEKWGPI